MQLTSIKDIDRLKEAKTSFYIYFSAPNCAVCNALKPKLTVMIEQEFPRLHHFEVKTDLHPEIAAQLGLYTNPSLLIFLEGQEILKRSRAIGVEEVIQALKRPYSLVFPEER